MKNQKEVWKDVKNYEGIYQVSNLGRVKSLDRLSFVGRRLKSKILKPALSRGYYTVGLCRYGKMKTIALHHLVAIAFLNHTPKGHDIEIDHIDNVKTNNFAKNLQLLTPTEHKHKDGVRGSSKYVGVSWNKHKKKWTAYIYIKRKQKYLGCFNCELSANYARQKEINSQQL